MGEPQRIMYVCSFCADNNPEMCGFFDRRDLAVLPDGRWLCESCFEDEAPGRDWQKAKSPPEYARKRNRSASHG